MLMGLYGLDEVGGLYQGLMSTGVKPGKALSQKHHIQLAVFQINAV